MSDKRSGLFEAQGKEMSSTMTADGLKDEVTQTLNKCRIIMTEDAERIRKKIDFDDAEGGKNSTLGDPKKGGTSRGANVGLQMQLKELEEYFICDERKTELYGKKAVFGPGGRNFVDIRVFFECSQSSIQLYAR
jgi:hypothetical protein